ncbi:MAG: tryptophan synthase subunit alpha [bacterium]
MNRIDRTFAELKEEGRAAFSVYLCAGDPDLETTHDLILALEDAGVDFVELGMPFSDPIADGPVIQAAGQRSLDRGTRLPDVLDLAARVRQQSDIPIALMTYYNLAHRFGLETLVAEAGRAGIDGLILPDLIPEEASDLIALARPADLATVFFVAPTSTDERVQLAEQAATGFIYCVSVTGITGARDALPPDLRGYLERVRARTTKPLVVGFGVSKPEHVRLLAQVADGIIVGSAVIREIEAAADLPRGQLVEEVAAFAGTLAAATR